MPANARRTITQIAGINARPTNHTSSTDIFPQTPYIHRHSRARGNPANAPHLNVFKEAAKP
jgi:hypothetical protein